MAQKYHIAFKEPLSEVYGPTSAPFVDRTIEVEFHDTNYAGGVVNLTAAPGNKLSYRGGEEKKTAPIITTELQLNVEISNEELFQHFFAIQEQDLQAIVKIDSTQFWQGFVVPDLFQRLYVNTPVTMNLSATDRIATLKDVDYPVGGRELIISVIQTALSFTGLDLDFMLGGNIFSSEMVETSSLFQQADIDTSVFQEDEKIKSCYEVLEMIMCRFNCRIMQWENRWHIDRFDEIGFDSRTKYHVDTTLVQQSSSTVTGANTRLKDYVHIGGGQTMRSVPGWKIAKLTQLYGSQQVGGLNNLNFEDWSSSTDADNWTESGGGIQQSTEAYAGLYSARIESAPMITNPTNYMAQTGPVVSDPFTFSFYAKWQNNEVKLGNRYRFMVKVGSRYLTDLSGSSWSSSETIVEVVSNQEDTWQKIALTVSPDTEDTVEFRFYAGIHDTSNSFEGWYCFYDNVEIGIVDPGGTSVFEGAEVTVDNHLTTFTKKGFEKEFLMGDVGAVAIGAGYAGAIEVSGVATTNWVYRGEALGQTLNVLILKRMMDEHYRTLKVIRGRMAASGLDLPTRFEDYAGVYYLFVTADWFMDQGEWEAEIHELTREQNRVFGVTQKQISKEAEG